MTTRYSISPAQLYVHGDSLPGRTVGVYLAADYDALLATHLKMRDRVLELVDNCQHCDGGGIVNRAPCLYCADLRELLL